jgi:hypothetical protein
VDFSPYFVANISNLLLGTSKRLGAKADELLERAAELELAGGARPIGPLDAALPLGDPRKSRHN